MNELQIFNNPEFGEIRTLEENGQVLFCGVDVAGALGYIKPTNAVARHCKGALKRGVWVQTGEKADGSPALRETEMTFIPESDLYRLIFGSKLEKAERFTDWVTMEVLPSIRRTGSYAMQQAMTPAQLLAAQAQVLVDMERRMNDMQDQAQALETKVDNAIKAFSRPSQDHWKADIDTAIKTLCQDQNLSVAATKGRMYAELEQVAVCNINARLNRLRVRKKKTGMRYRDAMELTKLDAIAADKQLRAIFEGVVRNWQARYATQVTE